MTSPPSLFADAPSASLNDGTGTKPHSLVDLLYDGFHMLMLLHHQKTPKDAARFSESIQKFLDDFERLAKKHDFDANDIFDAKYAFCAAVDESILASRINIRDDWERRPLQLALFGDQLAGEHFFDKLERARNEGAARIAALEVFHLCLLLGFKGKYLLEGPEKLKYLIAQLGEQLLHLKGKRAQFAPRWAAPDQIAHLLKWEMPIWGIGSLIALLGLLAYVGLAMQAESNTHASLAGYDGLVQLTPRPPTLNITLP
ncbi:type IVB secretion system protein IcmH/DotU [Azoarcus sp. KH32C]|uniref:type IVB secretion system protein IcmH/DotU n=1 Tax=Azoarcus sp. KH32C TaxID=748247 RepID=UPI0002386268|nr:type IVB secretion system protein IcmH/DotU [Azoarcus sp. KH32C]BAL24066.1 hypothetical protein AZKH_1753 [Azoarcus sp. KH32C]